MVIKDPSGRGSLARPRDAATAYRLTAERGGDCVCFFDFDGTLAPIRDDPESVWPAPGAVEALAALAGSVRSVAIVSARPVAFLLARLPGLSQVDLYGLYGLESQLAGEAARIHPDAVPYQPVMARLAGQARDELPGDALVEFKQLSVALHYRRAPELRDVIEGWAGRCAAEHGLALQAGRMVVELKPPGGRDKGTIVAERAADASCAWYFGDDLSDLRAFAAIDERERTDPGFLGVRVAVANPESGQEVRAAADLCVDAPEELPGMLAELVASVAAGRHVP